MPSWHDDPRLKLLDGKVEHDGFTFDYKTYDRWVLRVTGTGQLERGTPKNPQPTLTVPFDGLVAVSPSSNGGMRWSDLQLTLPSDWEPVEKYVAAYRRKIRDVWAAVAMQLKLPQRLELEELLSKRATIKDRYEGFIGLALGMAYAAQELDAHLAEIGEELIIPPKIDATSWNMAVHSQFEFLGKFGKQINEYAEQFEKTIPRKVAPQ